MIARLRRLFAAPTPELTVPALEPDPIDVELAAILATTSLGRHAKPWTEQSRSIDHSAGILEGMGVMGVPRARHKAVQP